MQMIPIPSWAFGHYGPPQSSSPSSHQILVPPRVQRAMDFLQMLDAKTMDRPIVNELHFEIIKGAKLTAEESVARDIALDLLGRYFSGTLKPDEWEQPAIAAQGRKAGAEGTGRIIHCPMCVGGQPQTGCPLCNGGGSLLAIPSRRAGETQE